MRRQRGHSPVDISTEGLTTALHLTRGIHAHIPRSVVLIYTHMLNCHYHFYNRLEGIIVEEDESQQSVHHPRKTPEPDIVIELIHEAVDHRPGIHYLVKE